MLKVRNLGFSYRQEPILRQVSFESKLGGFTSFVGASGCGKSTLLRLLAKLKSPSSGSIEWPEAQSVAGIPSEGPAMVDEAGRATVGFVFQKPTLCPWLSAVSNVELPLKMRGVSRIERRSRAMEALQLVGLQPHDTKKLPSQLSGGMQMRTSLARAFITQPSLMLMDEPFAALDEVLRQQLCETTLRLWRREHWTTLFVTHNVSEAVFLSQRIHILAGSPASIVKTFEIPLEERNPDLRSAPEYLHLVSEVSRELRAAVESSMSDESTRDAAC